MVHENRKPIHVLIVEDSEDDALLLLRELRRGGYDVTNQRVETSEAMQAAFESEVWDVVISDYSMPRFNGLAALELLKRTQRDIPFIMVSGVIGEERAVEVMKAGANDYVMKGNLARLVPVIERELREAEGRAARRAAEEQVYKLSRAIGQSASMVMITDVNGRVEYVNAAFTRLLGYTLEELIGESGQLVRSDDVPEATVREIAHVLQVQGVWRGEILNRRKDGEAYWASTSISAIVNADGVIVNYIVIQEDISERKRLSAELQHYTQMLEQMVQQRTAELQRAKEQIELILNNTSDAIILAESSGDILQVNPAAERLLGGRMDHAIERFLWMLEDTNQLERLAQALLSVMYEARNARIEASVRRSDGVMVDTDLALAPVIEESRDRAGVILSLRDITHLKELERFKTRFVANAAHDLSNPITILRTQLYLLEKSPNRLEDFLRVTRAQIERLQTLVSELRLLSELDRGVAQLNLERININHLLERVIEAHRTVAASRQQSLIFEPQPEIPGLMVDPQKCERIIVNLVANAVSYTPEGGRITVTSQSDESAVTIVVSDTGIGIPAEDLPHIFERFFRGQSGRRYDTNGTGLGLAIVKEMVEAHHGTIDVESVPDQGSAFTVRLPYRSA